MNDWANSFLQRMRERIDEKPSDYQLTNFEEIDR
mgnify:CR=1 FL=1